MSWLAKPGVGGVVRVLRGGTCSRVSSSPAAPTITVQRNGLIVATDGDTVTFNPHPWHRSFMTTIGDGFWVRFTQVSGDTLHFVGTLDTWLQLNTGHGIQYDVPEPGGPVSGTYTIEVSSDASGTPIVSASAEGAYVISGESTG